MLVWPRSFVDGIEDQCFVRVRVEALARCLDTGNDAGDAIVSFGPLGSVWSSWLRSSGLRWRR
eukprot:2642322-Alexandrium_andersonii.AAC.1